MPDPDKSEEIEVEIDPPITEEKKEIEVSLDEKAEGTISKEEFENYKKERKREEFLSRKLDRALKQIDELNNKISQPEPVQTSDQYSDKNDVSQFSNNDLDQMTSDKINSIAENNWQLAVDLRSAMVMRKKEKQIEAQQNSDNRIRTLETSKAMVRESFPDIDNPESEITQLYNQVLNEDNSLLIDPRGPEIAMSRMIRQFGVQPKPMKDSFNQEVDAEVQRRQRIGVGSLPSGRVPSGNTVILTQDQINSAKSNNVPLSQFAKMYKMKESDFKEGVTVDE